MVASPAGQDTVQSADAVARRLVVDAKGSFEGVDDDFLEQCAREAVSDVWHESVRVTTFVPVLAMRRMREIVSSRTVVVGRSGEP